MMAGLHFWKSLYETEASRLVSSEAPSEVTGLPRAMRLAPGGEIIEITSR